MTEQYLLIADAQALTDNAGDSAKVTSNVLEVALDYLAIGIVPGRGRLVPQRRPVLLYLSLSRSCRGPAFIALRTWAVYLGAMVGRSTCA